MSSQCQFSHPNRHGARSGATAILALLAVATFYGCLETEQTMTINPDGSGKVTLRIVQPDMLAMFGDDSRRSKAEHEQQKVQQFLVPILNSPGIDAWSNVTFKTLADGRIEFRGTGYFRSFEALKIDGNGGIPLQVRNDGEAITVWLRPEPKATEEHAGDDSVRAAMNDAQIAEIADSLREEYETTRPMLADMLNGFHQSITLSLPSRATRTEGWQFDANGRTAHFKIDGGRLLGVLDSMARDITFWQRQARNGNQPPSDLVGRIIGADSLIVQFPLSGTPQFNYAKEVAAARKQTAALRKKYKLEDR